MLEAHACRFGVVIWLDVADLIRTQMALNLLIKLLVRAMIRDLRILILVVNLVYALPLRLGDQLIVGVTLRRRVLRRLHEPVPLMLALDLPLRSKVLGSATILVHEHIVLHLIKVTLLSRT